MDPRMTILQLLEAIRERDVTDIMQNADAIATWVSRGGFLPEELAEAIDALHVSREVGK